MPDPILPPVAPPPILVQPVAPAPPPVLTQGPAGFPTNGPTAAIIPPAGFLPPAPGGPIVGQRNLSATLHGMEHWQRDLHIITAELEQIRLRQWRLFMDDLIRQANQRFFLPEAPPALIETSIPDEVLSQIRRFLNDQQRAEAAAAQAVIARAEAHRAALAAQRAQSIMRGVGLTITVVAVGVEVRAVAINQGTYESITAALRALLTRCQAIRNQPVADATICADLKAEMRAMHTIVNTLEEEFRAILPNRGMVRDRRREGDVDTVGTVFDPIAECMAATDARLVQDCFQHETRGLAAARAHPCTDRSILAIQMAIFEIERARTEIWDNSTAVGREIEYTAGAGLDSLLDGLRVMQLRVSNGSTTQDAARQQVANTVAAFTIPAWSINQAVAQIRSRPPSLSRSDSLAAMQNLARQIRDAILGLQRRLHACQPAVAILPGGPPPAGGGKVILG